MQNRPNNVFYENGVKLLANKFLIEMKDSKSEVSLVHEGIERTFEVWSKLCIREQKMRDDVWKEVLIRITKKNG